MMTTASRDSVYLLGTSSTREELDQIIDRTRNEWKKGAVKRAREKQQ